METLSKENVPAVIQFYGSDVIKTVCNWKTVYDVKTMPRSSRKRLGTRQAHSDNFRALYILWYPNVPSMILRKPPSQIEVVLMITFIWLPPGAKDSFLLCRQILSVRHVEFFICPSLSGLRGLIYKDVIGQVMTSFEQVILSSRVDKPKLPPSIVVFSANFGRSWFVFVMFRAHCLTMLLSWVAFLDVPLSLNREYI